MKIIILGSTSTIARGLMDSIRTEGTHELLELSRSAGNLPYFLELNRYTYDRWHDWDMVINCIGRGDARNRSGLTRKDMADYNYWDDRVLDCLERYPHKRYVYMSSQIVERELRPDDKDYDYWLIKRYIEWKHKINAGLNIMDIRVPALMSRYLRPDAGFFITEAVEKVMKGEMVDIWGNEYITYTTPYLIWRRIGGLDCWEETITKKELVELIDIILNGGHIHRWSTFFYELREYIGRRKNAETDSVAR